VGGVFSRQGLPYLYGLGLGARPCFLVVFSFFFLRTSFLQAALAAGLLAGLSACGDDPAKGRYVGDTVIRTDFEDLAGWGPDPSYLSDVHAHSGRQAIFIAPDREYSLTYHLPLGQASLHRIKALDVSAWVYLPSDKAKATLAIQVFRAPGQPAGPPLYSGDLLLTDAVHKYGKWQPIQHVFVLPDDLPVDAELRLYLWRASSTERVYLDDLYVKARE